MRPVVLLILAALVLPVQEEDAQKRLEAILPRLASEDLKVRDAASRLLLTLPLSLNDELLRRAGSEAAEEVRTRLAKAAVPVEWAPFVSGTLKEGHTAIARLRARGGPDSIYVAKALRNLEDRPPADRGRMLEALFAIQEIPARRLALQGMLHLPPQDLKPILGALQEHDLEYAAAGVLIASGDRSVCDLLAPRIQDKMLSDQPPNGWYGAMHVLGALGAPGHEEALARWAASGDLGSDRASGILAATPGPAAVKALEGLLGDKSLDPRRRQASAWILAGRGHAPALEHLSQILSELKAEDAAFIVKGLRHPALVRIWFQRFPKEGLELAALAGPAIRAEVLDRLKARGLPLEEKQKLVLLLGAVGGAPDQPFLRGLLREAGLQDAAAEALGRIGDPDDARPLMDGFRVYKNGLDYGAAMSLPPIEGLEKDLEEIFADPANHSMQIRVALNLARRSPMPRLRAALFKGLLDVDQWWGQSRLAATQILAETAVPEDAPAIALLRASPKPAARASGLFVALKRGDEAAGLELIPILAGYSFVASDAPWFLAELPPTPKTVAAVEAQWIKRDSWKPGQHWLALQGHEECLRKTREETWDKAEFWRLPPAVRWAIALREPGGAVAMMDRMEQDRGRGPTSADARRLAAAADPAMKERLLFRARGRKDESNDLAMRVLAAEPWAEAVPLYRAAVRRFHGDLPFVAGSARALGRLGVAEAADELRNLLRSPDPAQRAAAIEALAVLGDRASIPLIGWLLEDPDPILQREDWDSPWDPVRRRVWHVAMDSLETLTGKKSEGRTTAERRAFWREQTLSK